MNRTIHLSQTHLSLLLRRPPHTLTLLREESGLFY